MSELQGRCYKLTGNYGTFEIERLVGIVGTSAWDEDDWEDAAWEKTGIMQDLENAPGSWTFTSAPEGEDWEIERVI